MLNGDYDSTLNVKKLTFNRSRKCLTILAESSKPLTYNEYTNAVKHLSCKINANSEAIIRFSFANIQQLKDFCLGYITDKIPSAAELFSSAEFKIKQNKLIVNINNSEFQHELSELASLLKTIAEIELVINVNTKTKLTDKNAKNKAIKNEEPDSKVLVGKHFPINKTDKISEITFDMGGACVKGKPFGEAMKETKHAGRYILSFNITDYSGTVAVRTFIDEKAGKKCINHISNGGELAVKGPLEYDQRTKEIVIIAKDILSLATNERSDNAETKRVELHAHTKMSGLDGIASPEDLVNTAARFGHEAIAITDHGVVQAFPEAYAAVVANKKKGKNIKLIYGVEAYLVNDTVYYGPDGPIDDIVVFDIETTGLDKEKDKIIEIAAVRLIDGNISDEFVTYINPGIPISQKTIELTGITDIMVKNAPGIQEALTRFAKFARDSVLCAHNSRFDVSFIRQAAKSIGLDFNNGELDTLTLARLLLPDLGRHTLQYLTKYFKIGLEKHHRALDDTVATAQLFIKLIEMSGAKDLKSLNCIGTPKHLPVYHIILLVKDKAGLKNLYRLITESHLKYFYKRPIMPKSLIERYKDGLIVGSACEQGEIFRAILEKQDMQYIKHIAELYDYLEIQPLANNMFLLKEEEYSLKDKQDLIDLNLKIVKLGEETGKPVVATCDSHFIEPHEEYFRRILLFGQGFENANDEVPLYFRTTEEMLSEFEYLGEQKAREVVIEAPREIASKIESGYGPYPDEKFAPKEKNADKLVISIAYEGAKKVYGDPLPEVVKARLDKELNALVKHSFTTLYLSACRLVGKSVKDGYSVGSRGSVGSSFVAYAMGISEVNPLKPHYNCRECRHIDFETNSGGCGPDLEDKNCPHCGKLMNKDGYDIPFEVFLGFEGDKVPDIDLNFSGLYQSHAFKHVEDMFGPENVFRAGTVIGIAEKTAYGYVKKYLEENNKTASKAEIERLCSGITGVKRTTGRHPGGLIILPKGMDMMDFTPLQRPADKADIDVITTHFDFNSLHDRLVKLDILGHENPTIIRYLKELTGVDPLEVPVNDSETLSLFTSIKALGIENENEYPFKTGVLGIPEFGTNFVMSMLDETKPTTIAELIRISGLSHGTDVWLGNAQQLIKDGIATLKECICTRDDIMNQLIKIGVAARMSFEIMESVRKGKGLTAEMEKAMQESNVPKWFVESCKKIKYMFPKAHAVAYVVSALRIAYFKVHYPLAYYSAYFTVRGDEMDAEKVSGGIEDVKKHIKNISSLKHVTAKDEKELGHLFIALEMMLRGIKFLPIDINKSASSTYLIEGNALRLPLMSVQGMGESAALSVEQARKDGSFNTVEELRLRTKVNSAVIDNLRKLGALDNVQETAQTSMFI